MDGQIHLLQEIRVVVVVVVVGLAPVQGVEWVDMEL
tara:strand:+ start:157 stop:264 length:108 start_codon:yes stop_codon:yes gene_type:complete